MDHLVTCDLIGDLPVLAAMRWNNRLALVSGEQRWSYREFDEEVNRLTMSLQASGVRKGDKVAVWLTNCPEAEFLFFAVLRSGAILVPLNTRYRTNDLGYVLRESDSMMLITMRQSGPVHFDGVLSAALGRVEVDENGAIRAEATPKLRHVVSMGGSAIAGATEWEHFRQRGGGHAAARSLPTISPSDPALMVYTSGTTGDPKGVLLNHSAMRLCHDRCIMMGLTGDDVQLTYLPLFHTYAISYSMIMSFMCGAHQVLMDGFNADIALRLIEEHRVTVVHGFDAHFNDFLLSQRRSPRDISSLRFGTMTVGSDSSVPLARQVQKELCPTLSGYGMTEVWGAVTITPQGSSIEQRCEASGLPQPGVEIRVVDVSTGEELPAGAMGEIHVRSYSRMIGYHNNPLASAAAIDADGWFHTGDAGVLREDGHVRYLARYKDILKVGGENVSPSEVEGLISTMRGVEYVSVVGRPHERFQEVPVAFVVAGQDGPSTEDEVIGFCRGKLASFKVPASVIFVDQLPVTPTGKVQKEILRQRLMAQVSSQ